MQIGLGFGFVEVHGFGFGFGFNLPDRLGRFSDQRKYTGLGLGLGSTCHTGWVGFWICENSWVRIWVWVQSSIQFGLGLGFEKINGYGFGVNF